MSALAATLRLDLRLQARSRLYAIGILVSVLLGLLGRFFVAGAYAGKAIPILYLLILGGSTYIFSAFMVLADRTQGTLLALRTTPLTSGAYIVSKGVTLTTFAAIEGGVIQAVGFFGVPFHPLPLILGVLCMSAFFTFAGLGQVASHDSLFSFLIPGAMAVGSAFQLPVFYVLGVGPPFLWYLFPTQGPLLLIMGAFEPLEDWQWIYALVMSFAPAGLAALWAKRRFDRFVALQEGW